MKNWLIDVAIKVSNKKHSHSSVKVSSSTKQRKEDEADGYTRYYRKKQLWNKLRRWWFGSVEAYSKPKNQYRSLFLMFLTKEELSNYVGKVLTYETITGIDRGVLFFDGKTYFFKHCGGVDATTCRILVSKKR